MTLNYVIVHWQMHNKTKSLQTTYSMNIDPAVQHHVVLVGVIYKDNLDKNYDRN